MKKTASVRCSFLLVSILALSGIASCCKDKIVRVPVEPKDCTGDPAALVAAVREAKRSDCKGPDGKPGLCFWQAEGTKLSTALAGLIEHVETCR